MHCINVIDSLTLCRKGGRAFLKSLLPRLNSKDSSGGPAMPFELEVLYSHCLNIAYITLLVYFSTDIPSCCFATKILVQKKRKKLKCFWRIIFRAYISFLRCESCHGQAERLLDSAKEMEDSIAVNLRSP
ncbi:hypothetical protein BHE74_00017603 [Ensete ventricosum]|uniref:Uncharacterized protein n=1 Tax=Ensete ventricosum TaxID=4639 RepID=A0A427APJ5_ENSVE|nr:hypothetical protein B296_00027537 [Ensete ventricosum]RWW74459.1 hypothetical protein BHE74_00017603 [Ensete ventricosum]